jgi:hypothetical protein
MTSHSTPLSLDEPAPIQAEHAAAAETSNNAVVVTVGCHGRRCWLTPCHPR